MTTTRHDHERHSLVTDAPAPHDLDAEESLLGAIMLSHEASRAAAAAGVTAADFYRPAHGTIYRACLEVEAAGAQCDPTTVGAALDTQLEAAGGRQALVAIQSSTPASANAPHYAKIVRDLARRRRGMALAAELDAAMRAGDDPSAIVVQLTSLNVDVVSPFVWDDLDPVLDGTIVPPAPGVLYRESDGRGLFYPAAANLVFGADGTGKTWLALVAAKATLDTGGLVMHLDYDDTAATNIDRLLRLGCSKDALRARYRHRTDPSRLDVAHMEVIATEISRAAGDGQAVLVILDVVADGMTAHGRDENVSTDFVAWAAEVVHPMTLAGAAVILNDHTVKANAAHGGYSRGTGAKRAKIDGACYEVTAPVALARDGGGTLALTLHKDRHGRIGRRGETIARLLFQHDDAALSVRVLAPLDVKVGLTEFFVAAGPDGFTVDDYALGFLELRFASKSDKNRIREELKTLVESGQLKQMRGKPVGHGKTPDRFIAPRFDRVVDLPFEEQAEVFDAEEEPI